MSRLAPDIYRLALAAAVAGVVGSAPGSAAAEETSAHSDEDSGVRENAGDKGEAKKKAKKDRDRPGWHTHLGGWRASAETEAQTEAGFIHGHRTLQVNAGFLRAGVKARGELRRGPWRLRLPIRASHRQTVGARLSETLGEIGAEARYRPGRTWKLTGGAELRGAWRPGWPDQYQPTANGYMSTDRYSYWDGELGTELAVRPRRKHELTAEYGYKVVDYLDDPNFDPIDEPTHLVPHDRHQHDLELGWTYHTGDTRLRARAEGFIKHYGVAYARDAGTGKTHAGPGGPPPNPREELRGVEPSAKIKQYLGQVEVELSYGYEMVQDTFQGYYSYAGHHPDLEIEWNPNEALKLQLEGELWWDRYGPHSYAEGPDHPPLAYGDRRVDHSGRLSLEAWYEIARGWSAGAEARLDSRRTNFPAYEPGIFPASRSYDIDWNYDNWTVTVGVTHQP